jgi:hypothetical protein
MRTILLAALLMCLPAIAFAQTCTTKTDEFTGGTTVICKADDAAVEEHPDEFIERNNVIYASADGTLFMAISTLSESWNFLHTEKAYALVDGERVVFDANRNGGEVRDDGKVTEQMFMLLSRRELQQIARGDTVRMKMGQAVFDLSSTVPYAQALLQEL